MEFDRFTIKIGSRVVLLTATLVTLAWALTGLSVIFLSIALILLALFQVAELIRFLTKTNRELARFIFSLRHADYTTRFKEEEYGSGFKELSEAFQLVTDRMRENKLENESYLHFLNMVVAQIRVGIVGLHPSGEVKIMNQTASQLLDLPNLQRWERFEKKCPDFTGTANLMVDGDRILLSIETGTGKRQLSLSLKVIKLMGVDHRILTFYDIKSDLERREIDSYNKLISILTHEIMNSVTPVSSLTETISYLLKGENGKVKTIEQLDQEDLNDVASSIETIRKRSKGMLSFIQDYRKIAKIPEPALHETGVGEFLRKIGVLMNPDLKSDGIQLSISVNPPPLTIFLDQGLIEQVIINLLVNARHACADRESPTIAIRARLKDGYKTIEIEDNGSGIPDSIQDKVFVPFFSTKKTGSGIGLSLSQQIMQKHKGTIDMETSEGNGTRFTLKFRY